MFNQEGIKWVATSFGVEPRWTAEPDIDIIARIAREHLCIEPDLPVRVSFFAQGAFNKLFKIESPISDHLLRVSRPIYPSLKTESEVATIGFVHENTTIPVPRVVAFDSDSQNELGFEWILMEMMPGQPLMKRWNTMSWSAKVNLVKQLARHQAQLLKIRIPRISNIYEAAASHVKSDTMATKDWSQQHDFSLGPLVLLNSFWSIHIAHHVARGSFQRSHEWLETRLNIVLAAQKQIIRNSEDEDEIEDAVCAKALAERLLKKLPIIFPSSSVDREERCMLLHDDLSMQNILVDEEGGLTAVVDWEGTSALPLWRACQQPRFLEGRDRTESPARNSYGSSSDDDDFDSRTPARGNSSAVDTKYSKHLLEYEQTHLRKVFEKEMTRIQPDYVAIMKASAVKADFDKAIHYCDNRSSFRVIKRWLDGLDEGKIHSLADELRI